MTCFLVKFNDFRDFSTPFTKQIPEMIFKTEINYLRWGRIISLFFIYYFFLMKYFYINFFYEIFLYSFFYRMLEISF